MVTRYVVKLRTIRAYGKPDKWQYCNSFGWDNKIRTWETKEKALEDMLPYIKKDVELVVTAINTTI